MSGYVPWSVGWSLVPRPFPKMSCSLFFPPALFAASMCSAREKLERPQPTHPHLAVPVALDAPVDPTSELAIYAVSGTGKQPSWAASGSKPTTGAVDLSAGAAIRKDPGSAAAACCCCCCCCFDDDCSSCLFTFGHISYWSMCTHVVHGFLYCHVSSLVLHPAAQQECVPWLVLVDLDGRQHT